MYSSLLQSLQDNWISYPQVVSLETYAVCNAKCDFCPSDALLRKDAKMSMGLIEKIIKDLKENSRQPAFFNLSRVNEPFLDKRIFDIAALIEREFDQSRFNWFSNASTLNERNLYKLLQLKKNNRLNISFNDYRKDEYQSTMQIDYDATLRNIRHLHKLKEDGDCTMSVNLSRVGDGSIDDSAFVDWCSKEFPLFSTSVGVRFDWMGRVATPVYVKPPDVGCSQWFKLHILADGNVAFCCIDADGKYGLGNANDMHVVDDLYNHPWLCSLREKLPSRNVLRECYGCTAFA